MRLSKTIFVLLDFISILIAILILKPDSIYFLLLITFFWIMLNYLFNKYKFLDRNYKKSFIEISISSLKSFFILITTQKIVVFLIPVLEFYFSKVLFLFFLISSLSSIILRLIFEFLIQIFENNRDIYFVLHKNNLNFFTDYNFFDNEINKYVEIDSIEDIYPKTVELESKKFVLISDNNFLTKSQKFKLKKNNIKFIEINKWLEEKKFILIPENTSLNKLYFNRNQKIIYQNLIKRIADSLCGFIILTASAPIIFLASILIFLEDGGGIFYSQKRTGLRNKIIKIYKLRTMSINAEKEGPRWASAKDKRITKIGEVLRHTRIDELPQLINVIKGEMSLIGPRPERPEIDKDLNKKISNYDLRYLVKPGVSGWAQVNYPYASSIKDTYNKLSYDLFYVKNQSILLDLYIFIRTIKVIFNIKGSKPIE
tara:strand:+ start:1522 stop:2802 length:1281 start_codon:yes stop_codon:yes gene_type:complete